MTTPIVVVTACYGHAHFLPECIASVRAQTWTDYLHVIVNDASPDNTQEVAEAAAREDPRIRVMRHAANRGLAAAQNTAIAAHMADWYLKADADDWIEPTYLEQVMEAATANPELNVILSPAHVVGQGQDYVYQYPRFRASRMHQMLMIPGPAALRRELWERVGGFDERLRIAEDWDFWVRAERAGGLSVHQLDAPQWHYRQHDGPRVSTAGIAQIASVKRHLARHVIGGDTLDWRTAPQPDPVLCGEPCDPDLITLGDDQWSAGYWAVLGDLPGLMAAMVAGDPAPYMDWWRAKYPQWADSAASREAYVRNLIGSITRGYEPDRWQNDERGVKSGPASCVIDRQGAIWPHDGGHRASILRALGRPVQLRVRERSHGWTARRLAHPDHPDAPVPPVGFRREEAPA